MSTPDYGPIQPREMSEAELNELYDDYRVIWARNNRVHTLLSNSAPGRSGTVHPLQIAEEGGENEFNELDGELAAPREPTGQPRSWFRPSAVIVYALVLMVVFQQLTGWSVPFGFSGLPSSWRPKKAPPEAERGESLKKGSQDFTEVCAMLQKATPQTWSGEAAGDYTDATKTLMALAQQMAELDQQAHGVVKAQADVVEETRFILGIEQDFLIVMFAVVLGLEQLYGTAMFTWLWWFAVTVAVSAVAAGAGELISCSQRSQQHAEQSDSVRYEEVTAAALQLIAANPPALPRSAPAAHRTEFTTFAELVRSAPVRSANSATSTAGDAVPAGVGNSGGSVAGRAHY